MSTTHLRITAKRDGFRRAGIEHSTTPTVHAVKALSAEQIEALKAESMLVVEDVEGAEAPAKGAKK